MNFPMKTLLVAALLIFSNGNSFAQFGLGGSQKTVKSPENFEHIDCGFSYPLPGEFTLSTSIGSSPYRQLGQGQINRFLSNAVTYDIGCIDLDDPPRKMRKDEIIALLNSKTNDYLADSSAFVSLPTSRISGREIYEFETKTDFPRRIRYILEGNRVLILVASATNIRGIEDSLRLFNSVRHFSVKNMVEARMETAIRKSLPQSPAIKFIQSDAAHNNLKGPVKSVRVEAEDVPILVGTAERRIVTDDSYDAAGNLLKSYWFQDSGYPTSVTIYGFVDGAQVSDSEEMSYDTTFSIGGFGQAEVKSKPADPRYEYRYAFRYDSLKRLIERKEYNNKGALTGVYAFTYKDNFAEEKWFGADGKLNSTKRRQLDGNGNELTYKFWWYEETDNETEVYLYNKFDQFGNWTERQVVRNITNDGLTRTRTSTEFRKITYYGK